MLKLSLLLIATLVAGTFGKSIDERVIGGTDAVPGQFRFMASLQTTMGRHFCGSTIVADRWVLTAAHCTYGSGNTDINVVVGTISISSVRFVHRSSLIVNHPDYDEDLIANDVSVVQVATPFVYSDTIQPIGLSSTHIEGPTNAVVLGWGYTEFEQGIGTASDILQWLRLRIITLEECRARHTMWNEFVFDNNICTFTQEDEGICFGDSGSALVVGNNVVGIPSWVEPCAVGYPDVYARVSSHYDWIISIIRQ